MEQRASLEDVTLSALLHDIGKFYQRAEKLKKHATLSKEFLLSEPLKDKVETVFGVRAFVVAELTAKHHDNLTAKDKDALIIQKADRLSSGLDRVFFKVENFEKIESKGTSVPEYLKVKSPSILNMQAESLKPAGLKSAWKA